MSSLEFHVEHALRTTMSPRLQRAVQLLQMSSLDFAQVVRDALDSNPFLDQEDPAVVAPPGGDAANEPEIPQAWGREGSRRPRAEGDEFAFDSLAAPDPLSAQLERQINVLTLSERDRMLACAVAGSLEDDGYLRVPLHEVGDPLGLDPAPDADELNIALRRVQSLEPAGVGARNLRECLMLQLASVPCPETAALLRVMLRDHFELLAARDLRALSRNLARSREEIEAACAALRRLDPHPGWRFSPPSTAYVTPDVIARKVRGRWTAVLNEAVVPHVKLNRDYVELFQCHRNGDCAQLGAHLQEARWTVRNVQQRFSTIVSVAQAILDRQQHFLAYGAMAMKPLALRDIAQELGMHESTVSRVTNNKFIATPCGVYELKYFFSRGLATARGGECSPTAVRGLIGEIISAEDSTRPLSDVEIAQALHAQGLRVARRTVTKYRQQLKIESAERRRPAA